MESKIIDLVDVMMQDTKFIENQRAYQERAHKLFKIIKNKAYRLLQSVF